MKHHLRSRVAGGAIAAVLLLLLALGIQTGVIESFERLRAMQRLVTIPGVRMATFKKETPVGPADSGRSTAVAVSYERDANGPRSSFHLLWPAVRGVPKPNNVILDLEAPVPPEERTERFEAVARAAFKEPLVASAKKVSVQVEQSPDQSGTTTSQFVGITYTHRP